MLKKPEPLAGAQAQHGGGNAEDSLEYLGSHARTAILRLFTSICVALLLPEPRLIRLALFQPDIPQNTGTILRLCACLDVEAHIIEPAGFPVSDRHFRRAGMDYLDAVTIVRHVSWDAFCAWRAEQGGRLLLLSSKANRSYLDVAYAPDDILLLGRESAGVPDEVADAADERLRIPIAPKMRSLNVAVAAAMALGEVLRQVGAERFSSI